MNRIKEGILRRTKYRWEKIEVTIIVSTGRTGTNFLAKFFNENFQGVDGRHEPPMDMFQVGADYIRGKYDKNESVKLFYNLRYDFLKQLIANSKDYYVESNLNLSVILDLAKEVFPNLKIVHVVRDPKTCVKSFYNKSPDDSSEMYFMDEKDVYRERLLPKDYPEDMFFKRGEQFNRFQKVCWHWRKYNESVLEFASELNLPYLRVKFEDLFTIKNTQVIESLIKFMNISNRKFKDVDFFEKLEEKANYSRHSELIGIYETWDEEFKAQFHEIVDDISTKLGYK